MGRTTGRSNPPTGPKGPSRETVMFKMQVFGIDVEADRADERAAFAAAVMALAPGSRGVVIVLGDDGRPRTGWSIGELEASDSEGSVIALLDRLEGVPDDLQVIITPDVSFAGLGKAVSYSTASRAWVPDARAALAELFRRVAEAEREKA